MYRYASLHLKSIMSVTRAYGLLNTGNSGKSIISRQSDICIDGPYRCANHYMLEALSKFYPTCNIAHHYHSPSSLKLAVRFNIPSILVIREPIDQISSAKVFLPNISIDQHIYESLHFLGSLVSLHNDIIVSDFSRTTQNIKSIANEIQNNFGLESKLENLEMNTNDFMHAVTKRKKTIASKPSMAPFPSKNREQEKSYIKNQVAYNLNNTSNGRKLCQTYKFFKEISLKSELLHN